MTTAARTAAIQHRTSLPQRRAGLWATVKATATALTRSESVV